MNMQKKLEELTMLKFCTFCGRKLDTEGFCTNSKCPDYKRKELIEQKRKS